MNHMPMSKTVFKHLKLCILGLSIGILGGLIGAGFAHTLSLSTALREAAPWIVLLLPVGGVATVLLYRAFKMSKHGGTNEIIQNFKNNGEVKTMAAPLIFVTTAITHLFGGSAGREGAAIQLGGAGAAAASNALRLKDEERTVFMMSGMSALFAGVFGTPLTAAFFILEFRFGRKVLSLAVLPCLIAAIVAQEVSFWLGITAETVCLNNGVTFSFSSLWRVLILAIGVGLLGFGMCLAWDKAQGLAKRMVSDELLRAVLLGIALIALTACVGDMRYNNSGMNMTLAAVEGHSDWFDFILKILFTAITLAAGFKGGKIVPTFCVGATFGCFLGGILGLDVGLAAALGLVGLFCCVTNSPVSAVFLGIEMFGFSSLPYYVIVCLILWILSVNNGLFENRFFKSPVWIKLKK